VVLILVEYVNHGKMIKKLITTQNPDLSVVFSHGSMNAEFRNTSLDNLRNNKIDVFIATSILDEGVDVENINVLIYARGMESPRKLLQGIGRGLRKKKDDSVLLFYDFLDMSCRYLIKHSLSRYKTIKSQGFEVKEIDVSSI
jgi:superfamily II DNA or RNA helicase